MNKFWNILNVVLVVWLAYVIVTDNVSRDLKLIAWVLWALVVIVTLVKFHKDWRRWKNKNNA